MVSKGRYSAKGYIRKIYICRNLYIGKIYSRKFQMIKKIKNI